jgi:hypothetical protein
MFEKLIFKLCTKCKVEKNLDDFHKCKKNGYKSNCKTCKKEYNTKYRSENKAKCLEINKNWRETNKEYMRNYYLRNKDSIKEYMKDYYLENKENILTNVKEYYKENTNHKKEMSKKNYNLIKETDIFKEKKKEYMKKSYKKNPHIYAHRNILKRHLGILNIKKTERTEILLGYSAIDLKKHIESLFNEGMSWNNYGKWHIDHIKPISKFDKNEDTSVVNSLNNLQPLWAFENLSKGDTYE